MRTPTRLLVAVDSSSHALNAVTYVASRCAGLKLQVRLLAVLPLGYEETFWQLGMEAEFLRRMKERYDRAATECKRGAEEFLERCKGILVKAGFPERSIDLSVREWRRGIARDIIDEAKKGYDGVVVGRRGLGRVESLLLGSVSNKIVQNLAEVPVWVIGGPFASSKVLLAVDASENSRKAVEYAAPFLAAGGAEITLCHVVRTFLPTFGPDFIGAGGTMEDTLMAKLREDVDRMFASYRNALGRGGVGLAKISTVCQRESFSRAADILKTAREGGCGTIVMGRRGISVVREFLMGRVTTKVLNGAEGLAIWVVP
jgi:nucleotide-binding universal stress UspA family protein